MDLRPPPRPGRQESPTSPASWRPCWPPGQDLDRALRFMVETAPNPRVAKIMDRVREKVRGGSALAAALAQEPQSFPRLLCRPGPRRRGRRHAGRDARTGWPAAGARTQPGRTVQSALIYPALLLVAAIGSIGLC
jgi:general secretion pathway protein F